MLRSFKTYLQSGFRTFIALIPWLVSMYVFYWLEASGTWTSDTPHRGKISVIILAGGMFLSFLILSHFQKRKPR
jgi:hypothetical protein